MKSQFAEFGGEMVFNYQSSGWCLTFGKKLLLSWKKNSSKNCQGQKTQGCFPKYQNRRANLQSLQLIAPSLKYILLFTSVSGMQTSNMVVSIFVMDPFLVIEIKEASHYKSQTQRRGTWRLLEASQWRRRDTDQRVQVLIKSKLERLIHCLATVATINDNV